MPLKCSSTQARKLGKRLAMPGDPIRADLDLLEEILGCYAEALADAVGRLAECCPDLAAHPRVKTRPTLIDKLRRTPGIQLPAIRDIAGARIVLTEGGRKEQREITNQVIEAFSGSERPPKLIDRVSSPSHGYRALHVEVVALELPVEIQIRTLAQHKWAELTEALGDRWGRGIRYGEPPEHPEMLVQGGPLDRAKVWSMVCEAGNLMAQIEELDEEVGIAGPEHEEYGRIRPLADEMFTLLAQVARAAT